MRVRRILIEIGHPAHVHHFKHLYWELEKLGWVGLFVTKDKECAIDLLIAYNLPYRVLGLNKRGIIRKILTLPMFSLRMIKIAREFKPDIFVSRVSPLSGYASRVLGKPHITFTDTENVRLLDSISQPFADVILTSDVYHREHGKKQLRYPGYHELAYLHPNRFTPDKTVVREAGIDPDERYAIVRFVTWGAHHDIGHSGFNLQNRIKLVTELSRLIRVYISSEGGLPEELAGFNLRMRAEHMHQVLAHADFLVSESATMASECAMLRTPAVYLNTEHYGSTDSQAGYGLIYLYPSTEKGQDDAVKMALSMAKDIDIRQQHQLKKYNMLNQKIDVTAFMVWLVEYYPRSIEQARQPDFSFEAFR